MTPPQLFLFAPVTLFKQLSSFLIFNTPSNPNIKHSLKLISLVLGIIILDFEYVFILSIKYLFNAPPPVINTELSFNILLISIAICSVNVDILSSVLILMSLIIGYIFFSTHSLPRDFGALLF